MTNLCIYIKGRRYYHTKYHGLWNQFKIVRFLDNFFFLASKSGKLRKMLAIFETAKHQLLFEMDRLSDDKDIDVNDIANYSIV